MVSNHLPGAGEDFVLLLRSDCGVEVEGGRQGPGTGDVGVDQRRLNEGHRIWVADSIVRHRLGWGRDLSLVAGRWSSVGRPDLACSRGKNLRGRTGKGACHYVVGERHKLADEICQGRRFVSVRTKGAVAFGTKGWMLSQ